MAILSRFLNSPAALSQTSRSLEGVDLTLSWKPLRNNQFQSIIWGTELLHSGNSYDVTPTAGGRRLQSVQPIRRLLWHVFVSHLQMDTGVVGRVHVRVCGGRLEQRRPRLSHTPRILRGPLATGIRLRLQYTHTDHNAMIRSAPR